MSTINFAQSEETANRRPQKSPRWRYVYFLLAAFDLMTVSAGLYLNHRIMSIYTQSVEVNRVWAERVAAYSHLGELATDVDAPGNDVFDNRDVAKELARMRAAERVFDLDLTKQQQEITADLDSKVAAPLMTLLNAIAVAKIEMTNEAARIFEYFAAGRPDLAGQRMATMDHKYANLNGALLELRRAVGTIQEQNFQKQTAAAAELQRYEYLIGLSIVLMVLGATYYGHKIAQQMQSDSDEREQNYIILKGAEARTRSILDTAAEGIVTFDQDGRIESFNKAAERLFGYGAGEAIGQDISSMIPALAESINPRFGNDGHVLSEAPPCRLGGKCIGDRQLCKDLGPKQAGPCILGSESVGLHRTGLNIPIEFSVSKLNIGSTHIFTGIVRDISDRRKAEEALSAATAAQLANRAKSQFLANMSHEIRTPMNGVLGMAEMLLETELTATQRRFAETVHHSGESLLKIIDGILDFSKIEAGKLELECIEFNPHQLIDEIAGLMAESAEKKGLEFVCEVMPDVPHELVGAPSGLRQILTNLVGNAIKFTERGQVTIKVSKLDGHAIEPAGAIPGKSSFLPGATVLYFSVVDTGIGIAPSVQKRLFQAFVQADSSTTRQYGGTGLGLAISKQLVERMGGQIGVTSMQGRGAEFWFKVRLDAPQLPASTSLSLIGETSGGSLLAVDNLTSMQDGVNTHTSLSTVNVLLAEDNPINQDVARTMLESLGCKVCVVENGAKVLAALEDSKLDIVLMDCQMPEMDGFEATAEIRARRLLRRLQPPGAARPIQLPIVGITASALKGDREICIAAGMDDYLSKPFRREALRRILERWVLDQPSDNMEEKVSEEAAKPK